ncbi:hypothetical protein GTA08_BOTSDO03523 [Neofusicoccum parvum]|nr:hypothetical protein GTA08_BOTSDO03523 [Neofusicoccum parvum]
MHGFACQEQLALANLQHNDNWLLDLEHHCFTTDIAGTAFGFALGNDLSPPDLLAPFTELPPASVPDLPLDFFDPQNNQPSNNDWLAALDGGSAGIDSSPDLSTENISSAMLNESFLSTTLNPLFLDSASITEPSSSSSSSAPSSRTSPSSTSGSSFSADAPTAPAPSSSSSTTKTTKRKRAAVADEDGDAKDDLTEKRRRNNLAAAKYRQKKVDRISELEGALADVEKERDELRLQLARRDAELDVMRRMMEKR